MSPYRGQLGKHCHRSLNAATHGSVEGRSAARSSLIFFLAGCVGRCAQISIASLPMAAAPSCSPACATARARSTLGRIFLVGTRSSRSAQLRHGWLGKWSEWCCIGTGGSCYMPVLSGGTGTRCSRSVVRARARPLPLCCWPSTADGSCWPTIAHVLNAIASFGHLRDSIKCHPQF
jgi:hypothetical protein